jgi:large subunit ribosomal protein L1
LPLAKENIQKALEELRKHEKRNFKQSLDLIIKLKDLDLKKPENRLNQTVILPHQIGKADLVIGRDQLDELVKNKKAARKLQQDYDTFIAEASLMPLVGKTIGPVLGPRGKMPTPIHLNAPIDEVIEQARRTVKIRVRDQPIINCRVGSEEMTNDDLSENIQAVFSSVEGKLERGARNVSEILVKTTMEPPVKLTL